MNISLSKLKNQKGFTIIEVMIVLAVASLIMLIVFLAIPALQRSGQNTQRTSDATKIAGGINECLSNRNNITTSCDTNAEIGLNAAGTANSGTSGTLDIGSVSRLKTVKIGSDAPLPVGFPSDSATAHVYFSYTCTTDGSNFASGGTQQFAVLFNSQSSSGGNVNRCVGG